MLGGSVSCCYNYPSSLFYLLNISNFSFNDVIDDMFQVARLERVHQQAVRELDKISSDIQGLENELRDLHQNYEAATLDRQTLQEEEAIMVRRLIAADKLISGLSSEKFR